MEITQYTFQSPYSSQIQIGKPDTSSIKSDTELPKNTDELQQKAQSFQATQIKEVTPKVEAEAPLDLYA